jgi:Acetyltransferase (GNAT) family
MAEYRIFSTAPRKATRCFNRKQLIAKLKSKAPYQIEIWLEESEAMTEAHTYRLANGEDHTDILAVLEEVAPEIPVSLGSTANQEAIKSIIVACCASGESWVAVDTDGTVVGFVLAKKDLHENNAISLRYIGVSKGSRQLGIFAALIEKVMGKGVPLTASVLHTNCSDMTNRLMKVEFTKVESSDTKETKLRWTPKQAVET